jgi:hypothetical protein
MEESKKKLLIALGFEDQIKNVEENNCAWCGSDKTKFIDFKDNLSRKEFTISGMCQVCQDKTFG